MTDTFITLGGSAAIAVLVALVARRLNWNAPLVLIIAGAVIGPLPIGPSAPPNPETILVVVLAPLVFGEALSSSYLDLRRVRRPVMLLAIGLVVATTAVVGWVTVAIVAIPLALAFALGAILAPTDAVAVGSVARKAGLPRYLVSVLEGESLVNDGSGLTLLKVAVVAAAAGSVTGLQITGFFVLAVVGGVGVGAVGGFLASWLLRRSSDVVAVNSLVVVIPFVLYVAAEEIRGSGILAVVVSALIIAHAQNSVAAHTGRVQSVTLWKHVTFILQSLAYFLVGLELSSVVGNVMAANTSKVFVLVPVIVVALIATRFVFVFAMVTLGRAATRLPNRHALWRGAVVASWAGSRGPVSALAAFSVPLVYATGQAVPYRDVILATTFCVIVVSVVLSMTIAPLARALKVSSEDEVEATRRVEAMLARAELDRLSEIEMTMEAAGTPMPMSISNHLREVAERRLIDDPSDEGEPARGNEGQLLVQTARAMVRAEQEEVLRMRSEDGLPDTLARTILRTLDLRDAALRTEET
jgi:CPA1 family monovalent cation:H+ antiporter